MLEARLTVQILSDEIYEHIVFDGLKAVSFAAPALTERPHADGEWRVKGLCYDSFRIGYGGGPAALMKAMMVVQSQISSGACSIAQAATVAALKARRISSRPHARPIGGAIW